MIIMKIKDMHCDGCAGNIKTALESLDGVTEVSVSFEDKKATVKFNDEKISQEKLKKVIAETGYTVA